MLNKFEMTIMMLLNIAGFEFYTSEGSGYHAFHVTARDFTEACHWASKVCALARVHCQSKSLVVCMEYDNGIGERQTAWLRRWSLDQFESQWEESTAETAETYVWVSASTGTNYMFYFTVKQ